MRAGRVLNRQLAGCGIASDGHDVHIRIILEGY